MRRNLWVHPFLFALYPVLSFWASNRASAALEDTWRTLVFCLSAAGIIYLLAWWIARGKDQPALFSSLCVMTFFYFGLTYYSIAGKIPYLQQPVFFLIFWLVGFQLSFYLIFRFGAQSELLNKYLNWVSLILVIFPFWQLIGSAIWRPPTQSPIRRPDVNQIETAALPEDAPDIYYLILDGYARSDVLSEVFALDNSDFLNALRERGFYVADQSNTNYTQTFLSVTSSMTGNYIDDAGIDPGSEDRAALQPYLDQNSYLHRFNQMGYATVTMTDASPILFNFADQAIWIHSTLNDFELGFQSLTMSRIWSRFAYEYVHWKKLHSELDILQQLPVSAEQPQFVYAHLLMPHPPFVFDADGNFVPQGSFMNGDGSHYQGTREEYLHGYSLKVQYLNTRLIEIVDHLLDNPYRPVVIILQADHGSGSSWDFQSLENSCLRERLPILNVYYLPEKTVQARLYPSISPINSLRLIFDQILDQPMPLLEDRSFSSTWSHPYDLEEVTGQQDTCSSLP